MDCASVVLDFLGGRDALRGIGATTHALRAEVKASLPRLNLKANRSASRFPFVALLKELGRLQHLAMDGYPTKEEHERIAGKLVEVGLPARLQLLTYYQNSNMGDMYWSLLVDHAWPQLRCLSCHDSAVDAFLDALLARPAVVLLQLESLHIGALYAAQARKLLALLDRGAFPSLASLGDPARPLHMWPNYAPDTVQQVAVLRRLPAIRALFLDGDVAPFAELITSGGLPDLECVCDCLDI